MTVLYKLRKAANSCLGIVILNNLSINNLRYYLLSENMFTDMEHG
ncbi:hypothetical protein VCR4J5_1540017 [Vibrio crassostreae]|uniref:Uncharacterized protein n=1 Tax=Vibrio crassostreae TaxID=246167 RepID=A0A822N6I0_9VIBR|nr:hypothetical protein VCR4J5_1540017 [Vibrio crassostreae]CDT56323.1 hypothetical protein VCR5J5_70013 [Vibrio crassostreae]CDT62979.1 hypothetical protein VCR15J5_750027 [Vibrio crassostreae]